MSGTGWAETLRRFNERKKAEKKESKMFLQCLSIFENIVFVFVVKSKCNLVLYLLEAHDVDQSASSETELFTKYYNEWKGAGKGRTKSYDAIPRFYFKVGEC